MGETNRAGTTAQPPKRPPSSKGTSKLPFVVLALFLIIFIALIFILGSGNGERPATPKRTVNLPQPSDQPPKPPATIPHGKARMLPEGKLGEWAKSVVYLEVGTISRWGTLEFRSKKSGSGFVISRDGKIITNEHVVSDGQTILATFYDGTRRIARVEKADPNLDIAILTLDLPQSVPSLKLAGSSDIRIGRRILVMGFPLGSKLGTEMTLTDGLISSIRHERETPVWYQISAAVNSGNSGGPLLDEKSGEVLGVVTAKVFFAEGISLARPIHLIINDFLQGAYGARR